MSAPACLPAATVSTSAPLFTTDEAYASWTIDPSRNRLFFNVAWADARLQYLATQIGGCVVRFGGGGGDLLTYASPMAGGTCKATLPVNEECLNSTTLDGVLSLTAAASSALIVGLNIQPIGGSSQPPGGTWNGTNARALLTFLRDNGSTPWGIELGACAPRTAARLSASLPLTPTPSFLRRK